MNWLRITQVLVIGYSAASRTFAYLGIAQLKIFLGEVVLGWFLLRKQRAFGWFLLSPPKSPYVEMLRISLVAFVLYGLVSLLLGHFNNPHNTLQAFQNFAFNYYALYLVIGIWVGARYRLQMPKFAMAFGWIHGVYGTLWILLLNRLPLELPGSGGVDLFGQPTGAAAAVLMLFAYERRLGRIALPALLNIFVMVGVQVRAEWLGFLVGVCVWAFLARRMSQLVAMGMLGAMLLAIGLFFDVRFQGVSGRGGEVSVQGVVGRMLAPFDPHLAGKFVEDAEGLGGTAEWRQKWWREIWMTVNEGPPVILLFGHGYGWGITDVVGYVEEGIRTPHCIFFYALGYGGWCGVLVFVFFQGTLAWCLFRAYKLTGQAFGITFWTLGMIMALLGNQLETPFGAIQFYLLAGMTLKPLYVSREFWEEWRRPRYAGFGRYFAVAPHRHAQPAEAWEPTPAEVPASYRERLGL